MVRVREQVDDDLKEYNLDTYDDDSAEDEDKTNGRYSYMKQWHSNFLRLWNILQCEGIIILRE